MSECWNFFRYASINEVDEIISIMRSYKNLFSHVEDKIIHEKIKKKECIFESGVLITFSLNSKNAALGNYKVPDGKTILEQIAKKNLSIKSSFVEHVFTKFVNCALGEVYLAVNVKNYRAIKFYEKMNMIKIAETKLDQSKQQGLIYKINKL